jgi:hypothetical protein
MATKKKTTKKSKKNLTLTAKCKKWAKKNKPHIKTGVFMALATGIGCIVAANIFSSDTSSSSGSGSSYDVV